MGYTPLFDTMLEGSLYGRWPHTGIWACLLSRASRDGLIDEVPASLAAAIGVPVDLLMACINDFMQPDPDSRTPDNDGRRLELIDPRRSWGWRIVNHGKYREKARKKNYDEERTASGADAERKRRQREASRDVPTRPDASRDVPLSSPTPEAYAEAETESEGDARGRSLADARATDAQSGGGERKVSGKTVAVAETPPAGQAGAEDAARPAGRKPSRSDRATRIPDDWPLTEARRQVALTEGLDPERTHAKFCDYWRAKSGQNARKLDWEATWRNWCRTEADRSRGNGATTPAARRETYAERIRREWLEEQAAKDREARDAGS